MASSSSSFSKSGGTSSRLPLHHPVSLLPSSGLDIFVLSPLLRICRPFGNALLHVKNAFVDINKDERSKADKRRKDDDKGNNDENNEVREERGPAKGLAKNP